MSTWTPVEIEVFNSVSNHFRDRIWVWGDTWTQVAKPVAMPIYRRVWMSVCEPIRREVE